MGARRVARPVPVPAAGLLLACWIMGNTANADAETDYQQTCAACHGPGVAGAPRLGDAEAWKERIARGHQALVEHAINGFTGKQGVMPPKGGFTNLSDSRVQAIVEYMVSHSSND